jgi:hypothetical protein
VTRHIEILLEKRGVKCVAQLLDEEAPLTCDLVWNSLPLNGDVYHAKYASNEIYTLVPPLSGSDPGVENPTITPIPGDIAYFYFPAGHLARQFLVESHFDHLPGIVDLAIFYGRNNLLFSPATGPVPANVFAAIVQNLKEIAAASNDIWRAGSLGERLAFRRLESYVP